MLPGFDNVRMESFMSIHEGFKTMQDDQEEFTVDEIEQLSNEDEFADVTTIKAKDAKKDAKNNNTPTTTKPTAKESSKKEENPTTTRPKTTKPIVSAEEEAVDSEDETKEFITKYIESEEDEPEPTRATKKSAVKEGFQGSTMTYMADTKLLLITLIIVMLSFVLNMDNTRLMVKGWLHCSTKTMLCISAIFGILVYVVLKIFA